MTESVIELVVKDGDPEKVVAVACGTCRIVRLNKEVAAACCKKKECSVCGKNIERPRTICEPCQWAEADKKAAARQASNFNKAAKVLLKDYPHDIVCVSFFSDESDYLSIAEAMEPPDPEDDDSALSWAWGCVPMKWPVPDAVDLMGNYLDDFPEDAFDSFDSVGLQKVLDEWFEKANAAPPRFWMIDPKVVVIFDPERAPEKLGEGS